MPGPWVVMNQATADWATVNRATTRFAPTGNRVGYRRGAAATVQEKPHCTGDPCGRPMLQHRANAYLRAMTTPAPIYFSDIDGTLLNTDREPSELLIGEVKRLSNERHPFILISSRMPAAMWWIQDMLSIPNLPLIAYNGGLVISGRETVHSEAIPLGVVRDIAEASRGTSLSVQLFYGQEWYVAELDYYAQREQNNTRVVPRVRPLEATITDWERHKHGAHKVMVMGDAREIDDMVMTLERKHRRRLHLYRSKDDYLEIASREISKLTGIAMLLEHTYPHLTLADCVAFGDNYNDIDMLRGVGTGVAVGNAREEVKAVADAVTAAGKEDGVALWLGGR